MSKKKLKLKTKLTEIENSNVKSYFNLLNATDYFKKMMKDYTIDSKRNKKFSDIHSLLNDYRNQKIRQIPENDMLKDEVGEEIKKLKEFKPQVQNRRLSIKEKNEITKNKNKLKKRENRTSFLISLEKLDKQENKLPYFIQKSSYLNKIRENNEKELSAERIIYHKRYLSDNYNIPTSRKTILLTHNSTKSDFNTVTKTISNIRSTRNKIMHDKIDFLSNDLLQESSNLIKSYSNTIKNFSNNYDEWKKIQEIKFPYINKGFNKYGSKNL